MYNYHNNLRAAHPASSPWWAWPLDLKPVWFYQASFAGNTSAAIYDAGNLVIWWLEIPAIAFVAWQAFKRRSLALGLILSASSSSGCPGARSTGRRSSTTTTRACRSWSSPWPTSWPSCGTAPRAGPGCWPGSRRPSPSSGRACCGRSRDRCATSSGVDAANPAPPACVDSTPATSSDHGQAARRSASSWSSRRSCSDRPARPAARRAAATAELAPDRGASPVGAVAAVLAVARPLLPATPC